MKDYYKILNINKEASYDEIIEAYQFNISQFNNLPFLTTQMKDEIKELKEAKYVLEDSERRKKYHNIIKFNFNQDEKYIDNTQICNRIFSIKFSR